MKLLVKVAYAAILTIAFGTTARAEPVGNTSAIIPAATQKAPQGTTSDLKLRDEVIRNAELVTAEKGALEVTFLDGSKLTMGQNSRLTVDEYVYTGPGGTGKQTIRYTKGLFRFISGSIPKDQVKIETPTVTIGIRGTDFKNVVNEDGSGAISVDNGPNGEKYEVVITKKKDGQKIVLESGQMVTYGVDGDFGTIGAGQIQGCQ